MSEQTHGEGRHAVHELPETREDIVGNQDTVKDQGEREEELGDVAGRLGKLHPGDDHKGESGSELARSADRS